MAPRKSTKDTTSAKTRAECFMLCDVARLENGKLYVLGGGWDRITPNHLPVPYAFHVAIKLVIPREKTTKPIDVRLTIVGELGREIDTSHRGIRVELEEPTEETPDEVPLMIPLSIEVTLVLPGTYRLTLAVNDEPIAQTRFRVAPPISSSENDHV